ncbi:hypothetical protein Taro_012971 [Colocasia esculenta]|uniref:Uncharacterized protein n=1 Tax=Colocasia esculenta TaxID=4460 RepID=A0A843UEJ7_COLES|nr:hypothetical protein [Colocasia esculenta]
MGGCIFSSTVLLDVPTSTSLITYQRQPPPSRQHLRCYRRGRGVRDTAGVKQQGRSLLVSIFLFGLFKRSGLCRGFYLGFGGFVDRERESREREGLSALRRRWVPCGVTGLPTIPTISASFDPRIQLSHLWLRSHVTGSITDSKMAGFRHRL